jgi:nucleotide-binding universal stress UspA family protein
MRILLAYDGSEFSEKALDRAITIATKTQAEVDVLSVAADLCLPMTELSVDQCREVTDAVERDTKKALEAAVGKLIANQITARPLVTTGNPVDKILAAAESSGTDLIILGSRGRSGARRILLGSVSARVAEHAKCDVLIVK